MKVTDKKEYQRGDRAIAGIERGLTCALNAVEEVWQTEVEEIVIGGRRADRKVSLRVRRLKK
jgi:hypothetical protein